MFPDRMEMMCPSCHTSLQIADRQGIEVDFCPRCRGVWLDRGELEKIIERMGAMHYADERRERRYRDEEDCDYEPRDKRRRRGLLGELFDFD